MYETNGRAPHAKAELDQRRNERAMRARRAELNEPREHMSVIMGHRDDALYRLLLLVKAVGWFRFAAMAASLLLGWALVQVQL